MRLTTGHQQALAQKNNNLFTAHAAIEFFSLANDKSLFIKAPFAADGSNSDQIVITNYEAIGQRQFESAQINQAIFQHTRNRFGGLDQFIPWQKPIHNHVGYIGSLPNQHHRIDDSIELRFSPRRLERIRLAFAHERYPTIFTLSAKNKHGKVLWQKVIEDNHEINLDIAVDFDDLVSIISLNSMVMVGLKRLWLLSFTPSLSLSLEPFDIASFKIDEKPAANNPLGFGGAYIKALNLKIYNIKRYFDISNKDSLYANALRSSAKIDLTLKQGQTTYQMGSFYATDFMSTEESADVTIKALCAIGHQKKDELSSIIYDDTTAYDAFNDVARMMGFYDNAIDHHLKNLKLQYYALDSNVGSALSELCAMSGAMCFMNYDNSGLVVWSVGQLTHTMRYPLRLFKANAIGSLTQAYKTAPNTLEIEYSLYAYDGDDEIIKSYSYGFTNEESVNDDEGAHNGRLGYHIFPKEWHLKPYDRPIGAYTEPTLALFFKREELGDELYSRIKSIDITNDGFEYELLEYSYERDRDDNTITFKLWNFKDSRSEDEVVTVCAVGSPLAQNRELTTEEVSIPPMPKEYLPPDLSKDSLLERNGHNEPFEYSFNLDGRVKINAIKAGNYNEKGKFEFIIEESARGAKIKVWNYLLAHQTFSLTFFGQKIVESNAKVRRIVKNSEDIALNGEILESIKLPSAGGQEAAQWMVNSISSYYRVLKGESTIKPWRDISLTLYDRVAIESVRGYPYTEAMIDEVSLEFNGALKQSLGLKMVNKESRDCRCYGSAIFDDRPEVWKKQMDLTGGSV